MPIQADLTQFFQPFHIELNDNDAMVRMFQVTDYSNTPALPVFQESFGKCFTSHSSSDTKKKGNERGKCLKGCVHSKLHTFSIDDITVTNIRTLLIHKCH